MAPFAGFIGPTYTGRATQADAERAINFYPERIESRTGASKSEWVLLSRPGLALFASLPTSPVQAMYALNGRAFAVSGGVLYELFSNASYISRGAVTAGFTQIAASQKQLLIVSSGSGFIFTLATNTLTRITASGWVQGATCPVFIDGYFLCLEPASQLFFISGLNNGLTWNPLDFGDAEGQAGNVVGMIADHRQLWLLATDHTEVYYDSGNANFPFSRLEGAFMQIGCAAAASVVKLDNTIFWLGADERGDRVIYRADGYTPVRISNHSIEQFLQAYATTSDVSAYAYQEGGHTFYRLDFPSGTSISNQAGAGATWLYDAASGMWHERAFWNAAQGVYHADLARSHAFAFGKHLVGDYSTGNVYEQSMNYFTDNGALIRRVRRAPDLSSGGRFSFYSELRLLAQVGVGPAGGAAGVPPAPTVTPTFIQAHGDSFLGSASVFQTFTSPNAAGNAIVCCVGGNISTTVLKPTDTQGNVYELVQSLPAIAGIAGAYSVFVAYNIKAGVNTVTGHLAAAAGVINMVIREYKDLSRAFTVLSNSGHVETSNTLALGSCVATAFNFAVAIGATTINAGAQVPGGGYTWIHSSHQGVFGVGIIGRDAALSAGTFTGLFESDGDSTNIYAAIIVFGVAPYTPNSTPLPAYYDPQIVLRVSNDGGQTWGNEREASLGKMGEYSKLVRWRQLGRSNNRCFEVMCSEPVEVALIEADLDAHG